MKITSINPFTQKVLESFDEYADEQLEVILKKATSAYDNWRHANPETRKNYMCKVAEILRMNKEKYARTITQEMGKPIKEARAEIEKCAWVSEHYAHEAEMLLKREAVATDADLSYIVYDPIGTVMGIMPWNFPFWQVFRFAVPAIMAGNTIVIKHAPNVTRCALHIEDIFSEADPEQDGIMQALIIQEKDAAKIIRDPRIKAISFTGSNETGAKVATEAAGNIKKSILELGGNNPFIVLEDADIDKAVDTGITARMQNNGQSCIAAKRFILTEPVADKFMERYVAKMQELKIGDPMEEDTQIGPLATEEQVKKLKAQVDKSVKMGAKVVYDGGAVDNFYKPTLLSNVKPGMPVFDEEVFGPVASVITVKDFDEAVEVANQSKYGLGVSIFTEHTHHAEELVYYFDEGSVFFNDMVKSDPRLPFGGTKSSGYGRELGKHGIHEFVNVKTIYLKEGKYHHKPQKEEHVAKSMGG
ncbi:MAG: aldehyde dehydrogenase family protein [Bacteroidetes bacterium]|jgi:succinate-semialdehyde dehydrogenase/glutarate-semialdehyde dehydrogenase|nr:aldehyde dehydrogenase family protein [Bacteroidota bacterium]